MKNSESKVRIINMSDEASENEKTRKSFSVTGSMIAKAVTFFLAVLLTLTLAVCVVSAIFMTGLNMYTTPKSSFKYEVLEGIASMDCDEVIYYVIDGNLNEAEKICADSSIATMTLTDETTGKIMWKWNNGKVIADHDHTDIDYYWEEVWYTVDEHGNQEIGGVLNSARVQMTLIIDEDAKDTYYFVSRLIEIAYSMLYWVYVVGAVALILVIACVVFLVCSSGHRAGCEGVKTGWGTKVPFDMLTAITMSFVVLCIVLFCTVAEEILYYDEIVVVASIVPIAAAVLAVVESVCIGWLMSFALRIKLGKWWRNTVAFYVLKALLKFAKFLFRQFRRLLNAIRNISFIWKTFLSVVSITLLEFIIIMCCWHEPDNYFSFWIVEKLVLIPLVLSTVFTMKKLQKGAKALSEGELNYQVNTEKMWGDFRSHGEVLNSIAQGMAVAVDEQIKSERMKTELITNVSHDIKTPLTSIINYTDLIVNEPCENVKITEYAKVLARSSERLKRLIEDLVEASKASTGSIEMIMTPCNTNIMLAQAVGEYAERLKEANLELIVTQPEETIMIMADGRRLWRVFDNLINNVCKYAQEFTRVYLSLEKAGSEAVITLKNTSRVALNISEEELMERFVRGDQSRNTEGNGLGLSIARSLTQLQNGTLDLSIDGDLFKVILSFPII